MKITIDLPELKLSGLSFEDEILKKDDYSLYLWKTDLSKLGETLQTGMDIFFQSEMVINKEILEQSGLDVDKSTIELANILFGNMLKAHAVKVYTGSRYDEIEPYSELKNDVAIYSADGSEFEVYTSKEMIATAREFHRSTVMDHGMIDVIGSPEYIDDYFDVIDVRTVVKEISSYIDSNDLGEETKNINTPVALIQWMIEYNEELGMDIIEDNFDFDKYSDQMVETEEDAVSQIDGMGSSHLESEYYEIEGFDKTLLHIFERF